MNFLVYIHKLSYIKAHYKIKFHYHIVISKYDNNLITARTFMTPGNLFLSHPRRLDNNLQTFDI